MKSEKVSQGGRYNKRMKKDFKFISFLNVFRYIFTALGMVLDKFSRLTSKIPNLSPSLRLYF
jgi:hypothetical protein